MFSKNTFLIFIFLTLIIFKSYAEDEVFYRSPHAETCFKIEDYEIPCGNFVLAGKISTKKYKSISNTGQDVLDSFSASTHPGDHPNLRRLAKWLGYTNYLPLAEKSIFSWSDLEADQKTNLLKKYSSVANTEEARKIIYKYLNVCISYWAHEDAMHDDRKEDPTLSEVSALCLADSGAISPQ
jgi:hypothetical protein